MRFQEMMQFRLTVSVSRQIEQMRMRKTGVPATTVEVAMHLHLWQPLADPFDEPMMVPFATGRDRKLRKSSGNHHR